MKIAPIEAALARREVEFEHVLIHTDQHYDDAMSKVFLEELGIGEPQFRLAVGSGSRDEQIARVVARLEPILRDIRPDVLLVPGDVNSTLGGALAAERAGVPVGHVESGLRSFDPAMPEEANRVATDGLSTLLFTHSPEARVNLLREGVDERQIHEVGNTMIDTLDAMRDRIEAAAAPETHGLERGRYLVVTLHRPALVDEPGLLEATMDHLTAVAADYNIAFPVHPRTRQALDGLGARAGTESLKLVAPLPYVEFLSLVASAAAVITDSGGLQEETTALGIPCFTLRDNTERPVTVERGTNTLLGLEPERLRDIPRLLAEFRPSRERPPLWDGHAAERIVSVLADTELSMLPLSRVPASEQLSTDG
jgi:UDP-N-acetylglucosamine 2-epimerase (non-hydrolysing)